MYLALIAGTILTENNSRLDDVIVKGATFVFLRYLGWFSFFLLTRDVIIILVTLKVIITRQSDRFFVKEARDQITWLLALVLR